MTVLHKRYYQIENIETGEINHCVRLRLTPMTHTIGFGQAKTYEDAYIQAIEQAIHYLDNR